MTEKRDMENEPPIGATHAAQPGPGRTGEERAKVRTKARAAALAAAKATRANQAVEDADTARAIANARKEAGK
jgi:hypothetical protein